ncbi:MAG TPA: hypothetical protein VM509_13880, partial [Planctomycetota bacterium]|nr:hypothetical protein [Planctomycetota bacterium]
QGAFGGSVALGATSVFVGDYLDSQAAVHAGVAYVFDLVEAYTVYCVAKNNSLGCSPSIAAQGAGSATQSQGMVISCAQVLNNKPGLLLYSIAGRSSAPFQGGILCVSQPVHRTPGLSSGGTSAPAQDCSGAYSIDMNSFARGALGGQPIPALGVPGTLVQCQWWGRDPGFGAPNNSMLSDAAEYTIVQ